MRLYRATELNIVNKLATYSATLNYIKSSDVIKEVNYVCKPPRRQFVPEYNTQNAIALNFLFLNYRIMSYKGIINGKYTGY